MVASPAASPSGQLRVPMTPKSTRSRGRYARSWARGLASVDPASPSGLPETRERMCPACHTRAVVGVGPVTASETGIRCAYRCPTCATEFVLVLFMRRMIDTDWSTPDIP
jgi:hypothetical protein